MNSRPVAALFVRADSIYKTMPGVDCYDIERDALTWPGGCPVVAHPPCRGWGKLFYFAKPAPGELDLGPWAAQQVRTYGGVLEHPKDSKLWEAAGLPRPGQVDAWGGWTLPISQHWWGHRAEKLTWLYIVGCTPADMPLIPLHLGRATHVIAQSRARRKDGVRLRKGMEGWRPEVTRAEREATPPPLAEWLVEVARRCIVPVRQAA
ncbi:hypothetical protein [Pigmentiphaga sp. CHJ604]|uniref:hypothetical protein n=1 Tax=Pigmentiphaga sp. CHJ604 TaxID=3081984 RepID=UPI0030D4B77C